MEENKTKARAIVGSVVRGAVQKTTVVEVERRAKHPLYQKTIRRHKKYLAHDERNECALGDTVEIMPCRPLSARKRFRVFRILKKAE